MSSARVALISGASRGIGAAIARELSAQGVSLALTARSLGELEALAAQLPNPACALAADLSEPAAAAELVQATLARYGRLDIVVNNAGATPRGDFLGFSDADWDAGFALKFFGAMRLCRAAWPELVRSRGCIVNIAGIGGRTGNAEFAIGGSVNAALLNLTKALADRGVGEGVRVNAVNPSSIATERTRVRIDAIAGERGIDAAQAADELARRLGVARFGEPAEVARVVAFLTSDAASYMQGAIVDVDGGQTRTL
ncbi:SDR family NAD(P)-dependent oxidoreductase [Lysobacter sp. CA199]|uniref:SDR family NAD(P)-dependent oxidoreductase n=1 Tax=Lysobacter sp. CA199 TaxID=3455608 RepID=UPI003F8D6D88